MLGPTPDPAPRFGHTIPDISDQKNLHCGEASQAVSPKPTPQAQPQGKTHQEAQREPAPPSAKVWDRDVADHSRRAITDEHSDMEKARSQEITNDQEKHFSKPAQSPATSPASSLSGPTLHQISDEKPAQL